MKKGYKLYNVQYESLDGEKNILASRYGIKFDKEINLHDHIVYDGKLLLVVDMKGLLITAIEQEGVVHVGRDWWNWLSTERRCTLDKVIELLREELKKNKDSEYALDFVYAIKLLENQKMFDDRKEWLENAWSWTVENHFKYKGEIQYRENSNSWYLISQNGKEINVENFLSGIDLDFALDTESVDFTDSGDFIEITVKRKWSTFL